VLLDADSFRQEAGEPDATVEPSLRDGPTPGGRTATLLRGMLADAQVEVSVVDADTPLALRPPTGRARRWEFKVLATGRALAVSTPGERAA
jgi:hypothetical protein